MRKAVIIFLISNSSLLIAQTPQWVSRYNGPLDSIDFLSDMKMDNSGNIIVTGYSIGAGTDYDWATIKYNSSGVQQWVTRFNGNANGADDAYTLTVDASGYIYVTGFSSQGGNNYDMCTIKYNSAGIQQWGALYNGPGNYIDVGYAIAVDLSGNVYVAGRSYGIGSVFDIVLIKYNSSGVTQWVARVNGPGNSNDEILSMVVDASSNIYVTGSISGSGTGTDFFTAKYASSGGQSWSQTYNGSGSGDDEAYSVAVGDSGNVFVTGYSLGSGTGNDWATIKYNSFGVQQWVQRYNGPSGNGPDYSNTVKLDNLSNIYVCGYSTGAGTSSDMTVIKYNSSGTQQWVSRYNGPGNYTDIAYSLVLDNSYNVYITGFSDGGGFNLDYATIKYNSAGVQQWVARYNGPGNGGDRGLVVALDSALNVVVAGYSCGNPSPSSYDYCTIKYSQPVGIKQISNNIPRNFHLYQNYPNPFNPGTRIKFDVRPPLYPLLAKEGTGVVLKVFDNLGREVATLVKEELKSGSYEVEWDASNYPSGVYFYRLEAENFLETKKLTLLK